MKKVGVWYYFIISVLFISFLSCKPIHDQDQHRSNVMEHFYKVFNGKITTEDSNRSKEDPIFKYITFNETIRKYFKNTNNNLLFKPGSTVKVYQYVRDTSSNMDFDQNVLGKDTVIVLINDVLPNNVENASQKIANSAVGRGNMGCIPKFEQNVKNELLYFDKDGIRYLPLMTADHLKADQDSIVHYLTNYNFPISIENYKKIDSILTVNSQIEGGLDRESGDIFLRIYHQKDTLLTIKKM